MTRKSCKLCGAEVEKLSKCHILPRAMTRFLAGKDNTAVAMSVANGPQIAYANGCIYDKNLVCAACEDSFHDADTHFIEFWQSLVLGRANPTLPFGTVRLRTYPASSSLLYQFVAQTLVRAHLSNIEACQQFQLHTAVENLVDLVRLRQEAISVGPEMSIRFVRSGLAANMMIPYTALLGDHELYELILPHMRIQIAKTSRLLPTAVGENDPIVLRSGRPVTVYHSKRLSQNEIEPLMAIEAPNAERHQHMTIASRKSNFVWI